MPSGTKNLDDTYGAALLPEKIDPLETVLRPRSLHLLSETSGNWLRKLLAVTEHGLGVCRFVYCELPILWIVDEEGQFWFAIEEIVDATNHEFIMPRTRSTGVRGGTERLGHPSLIAAGPGRIGGEIIFDNYADPPAWYITNASGRYGLRHGRSAFHLANASRAFLKYGIRLQESFIPTRSR